LGDRRKSFKQPVNELGIHGISTMYEVFWEIQKGNINSFIQSILVVHFPCPNHGTKHLAHIEGNKTEMVPVLVEAIL
jgi:hypothetical protein